MTNNLLQTKMRRPFPDHPVVLMVVPQVWPIPFAPAGAYNGVGLTYKVIKGEILRGQQLTKKKG
jgi:hypothetical protein